MTDHRQALPNGVLLPRENDYRIDGLLGEGGFGVTYLASDLALKARVAIKEYFPRPHAYREQDTVTIASSNGQEENFQWGLQRFREEMQTLAGFQHPHIVGVKRVFDANNTAYAVLNYEEGKNFNRWLRELGRPPTQQELDRIVSALLEALDLVHSNGLLHRDISPDNIIVRKDFSPVLIDFGSARRVLSGADNMSAVVKAGYSPLEQYSTVASDQGPWSDIYSLGGTLYYAVTGNAPPPSPDRAIKETYVSAAQAARGSFRVDFLDGIDRCLQLRAKDRPQTIAGLRDLLNIGTFTAPPDQTVYIRPGQLPRRRRPFVTIGVLAGLAMLAAIGAYNFDELMDLFKAPPPPPPHIDPPFEVSARTAKAAVGSVMPQTFNGHVILFRVVGSRHRSLEGRRFRKPPSYLFERLEKLRAYSWHQHFKHLAIVGPGGEVACKTYCDFNVPSDVFGYFVAAVDEAKAEDAEPAAPQAATPGEQQRQSLATEQGWSKAVAILEEAAAEDDKKAKETKDSATPGHVFEKPTEQVDVTLEDAPAALTHATQPGRR